MKTVKQLVDELRITTKTVYKPLLNSCTYFILGFKTSLKDRIELYGIQIS